MNKLNPKLIWALYITGLLIVINAMYMNSNFLIIKLGIGSFILFVALVFILKELWGTKIENKWPWTFFLVLMGGIAIPVFMLTRTERNAVNP
ncbi:MAG: hypothetical protein EYC69_08460 [Bacteroidetes bacterium]|nr:MAG: hypothetical protein EYC69_08460 [Bacteroidota bacterium]